MIVPHHWALWQVVSSNFLKLYQGAFFANFIVFHLFPSKFVHPPSESLVEIPFQLALVYINSHLLHSSQTNIVFHNRDRVFISSVAAFPKLFQYSEHIFVQAFCSALFSLFSFLYFLFCYFFQFFYFVFDSVIFFILSPGCCMYTNTVRELFKERIERRKCLLAIELYFLSLMQRRITR